MSAPATTSTGVDRRELAAQLRVDSIRCSDAAGSGHPTSSMSAADLLAVLIDGHLRLDYDEPNGDHNDHLIFSKGHASPLYYSVLKAVGSIDDAELLTFRKLGSRLEGHPTPRIPPTDVATGSLGQGLPVGVGLAISGKLLEQLPYRVWVLCGDSEMAEGSMWEAFEHAGWRGLDNLVAVVDVNRLGQTRETMHGHDTDAIRQRVEAFGWDVQVIDGHDVDAIEQAYQHVESSTGKPHCILARTLKGKGVKAVEDQTGKHGKPIEDAEAAIEELGGERSITIETAKPDTSVEARTFDVSGSAPELPTWELGDQEATRKAYGLAVAALVAARADVVALDGEVSNSTHAEEVNDVDPERFLEMFIAEQQLVASAVGLQRRGWVAFCSSFAAFFSRAYDFVRMAAVSQANLRIVGSHAGVAIGEDGPSQMALEDFASLRAVHDSTVLAASDANQAAKLVALMADREGISYLRTLRGKTTVRTPADEALRIGGSRELRTGDALTIAAIAGSVDQAYDAAEQLAESGIECTVLDCYSLKPLDEAALTAAVQRTGGKLLTVEDHLPEGGLGDACASALAEADLGIPLKLKKLAVTSMPGSGTPEELIAEQGIDAAGIAAAAKELAG